MHELLDDPDVVFPGLQGGEGFVYVGAGALGNKVLASGFHFGTVR